MVTRTAFELDLEDVLGEDVGVSASPLRRFETYFDLRTGAIGRVVGSEKEPAGAHQFCMWAADSATTLDVGHIVVTTSEEAVVIGVVDEPRRFSDLRTFLDDFYDRHLEEALLAEEPPTRRPEILVFTINVLATRHLRDDVTSNRPAVGGPVYFATSEAIEFALGRKNFTGIPIPALMHTNGNAAARDDDGRPIRNGRGDIQFQRSPIWLDEDYLLGPEAGHANWTGQSGLATKTSHAIFLTSAVFQSMRQEGKSVAALMFNVKGPDLLWLDKPALPDEEMEEAYRAGGFGGLDGKDLAAYEALDLRHDPFANLHIFAPFKPGQQPMADHTGGGVVRLGGKLDHSRLNTLRNGGGETACVHPVLWELLPLLWRPHKVFEHTDLDDKLFGFISEIRDVRGITTLDQLDKLFTEIEAHFQGEGPDGKTPSEWRGHHQFTIRKARNRFNNLATKFGGLLTDGAVDYGNLPKVDAEFGDQEVRVVDIAACNTNVQEVLVNSIIGEVWKKAEHGSLGVDKVIVFVDELNKYAPGGGEGGLRDTLVDIAARGRHLNVVLFGAQQFRSKVDTEILGNCGTSFYGRIGDEEIINPSYRSLSDTAKAELLGLPKGRLLVRHAHFRAPVFGAFPHPPTIPGMVGQKVFNAGRKAGDSHPGDALYRLMLRLMPTGQPSKSEVRTHCEGFTAETIDSFCDQVQKATERARGTSGERITAWSRAKSVIGSNPGLKASGNGHRA